MIEEDMSFMEPVFMNRELPFPEYLVSSGYHPMTQEILNKYRTSSEVVNSELLYRPHSVNPRSTHGGDEQITKRSALGEMLRKYGLHFSAKYEIPCKGGAVFYVSVISGKMFYSRVDAPYEVLGRRVEEEDEDGEPMGYQTDEQLMIYLAKLIAKAKEY